MFLYKEGEFDVIWPDIWDGFSQSPTECAVAKGAKRHFGNDVEVTDVYLKNVATGQIYRFDNHLVDWVDIFDEDKNIVKPIRVVLYKDDNDLGGNLRAGIAGDDI